MVQTDFKMELWFERKKEFEALGLKEIPTHLPQSGNDICLSTLNLCTPCYHAPRYTPVIQAIASV